MRKEVERAVDPTVVRKLAGSDSDKDSFYRLVLLSGQV